MSDDTRVQREHVPTDPSRTPPDLTESKFQIGTIELTTLSTGTGKPILVLHDELGFEGWMQWTRDLAADRRLIVPLQPGFGHTPRAEWIRDYRDVASFYLRMVREQELGPVDVIGFSAGGYIAAEMAAACPEAIDKMVLVAPLGVRPAEGEIFDFLAVTARSHLAATIANFEADEVSSIYGGEMTPEQFELFEAARAETSRLGWEPFMFSPSLPMRLGGVIGVPTLIAWGAEDQIAPVSCGEIYADAIDGSRLEVIPSCGHRPEIEAPKPFVGLVADFLKL